MSNIYKPILYQTEMVQSILDERKTKTRRTKGLEVLNKSPDDWNYAGFGTNPDDEKDKRIYAYFKSGNDTWTYIKLPWNVGDILWVRETFSSAYNQFLYKANERFGKYANQKWKPSLFMPKEACRLFLKVISVKVERLFAIPKEDAISEGINLSDGTDPRVSFYSLWISIYGENSFKSNPWVWVIEFEKIDKPEDFR